MKSTNSSERGTVRNLAATPRPYVIAELSGNHNGSLDRACTLIQAAADAGADAVKFQHYTPDTITVRSDHPDFRVGGGTLWDGQQLADLYAEAMTPWEWTPELVDAANNAGIEWLSSPFDPTAVDFLDRLEVPALKIASFEIVDLPLIRYAASKGRPMIISTGMASLAEIDAAVEASLNSGAPNVTLLRCNSAYPAQPKEMDLLSLPAMKERWRCPVGLSDHTLTSTAAIAAVALGATVIEKHLTLRRGDGGPDAAFSIEPEELRSLVNAIHDANAALGRVRFGPAPSENASRAFRRSLRASRDISHGETITSEKRQEHASRRRAVAGSTPRDSRHSDDTPHQSWSPNHLEGS